MYTLASTYPFKTENNVSSKGEIKKWQVYLCTLLFRIPLFFMLLPLNYMDTVTQAPEKIQSLVL